MILILSVGLLDLAFFHLIIHAMFKALLFLCAGVVIHGLRGAQDIRFIGLGLKLRPSIRGVITLARLSLGGFPFLRGFYSKDLILESVYMLNRRYLFILLIIASTILTVVYSLRLIFYSIWRGLLEVNCQGYYETFYILNPIFIIGVLVVILGGRISWAIFPCPIFVHLTLIVKIINLGLIFLGVIGFFIYLNKVFYTKEIKFVTFLGGIWFLPQIIRGRVLLILDKFIFYFLKIDQGWFEEFGGGGVIKFNQAMSYKMGTMGVICVKFIYIFIGVFLFVYFIYFYSIINT